MIAVSAISQNYTYILSRKLISRNQKVVDYKAS